MHKIMPVPMESPHGEALMRNVLAWVQKNFMINTLKAVKKIQLILLSGRTTISIIFSLPPQTYNLQRPKAQCLCISVPAPLNVTPRPHWKLHSSGVSLPAQWNVFSFLFHRGGKYLFTIHSLIPRTWIHKFIVTLSQIKTRHQNFLIV